MTGWDDTVSGMTQQSDRPACGPMTRNFRTVGSAGEDIAAEWFTARGYELIERNFYTSRGEIDIILRTAPGDDPALVFVEVKWRFGDRYGTGAEAVTPAKLAAMRRAALEWIAAHPTRHTPVLRFDVLDITDGEITHYEGVEGW